MRIGIDYTAAVRQSAGIGRYVRELVQSLLSLDADNEYAIIAADGGATEPSLPGPGSDRRVAQWAQRISADRRVRPISLPVSDRMLAILWHRLRLPLWVELACGPLNVFHSPDFTLPPVRHAKTVLTVHDLSFLRLPDTAHPKLRSYLERVVPRSVARADLVLADSENTRQDVIELLHVDPSRVLVIYPGVDQRMHRVDDNETLQAVRKRYALPEYFVLGVGTLQPRKNLERLLEAYASLCCSACAEHKLVLVGREGWMSKPIFDRVRELQLQERVQFTGYVLDADLAAVYSLADLFVFPSLYEGFGLPPLEAMACGTPVVISNTSSLPEVAGDAALLVNPLDVVALAEGMRRALTDDGLRASMMERGLQRACLFDWAVSARKLLAAYGDVAG